MKTLVICNDPPYGTERSWNGLRLAGSLARRDGVEVRVSRGIKDDTLVKGVHRSNLEELSPTRRCRRARS